MSNDVQPVISSGNDSGTRIPAIVVSKSPDGEAQHPVVLVARFDSQLVAATLLSLGVAAGLILFVIESFLHPSAATILVPLIVAPAGQMILTLLNKKKTIICPNCKATLAVNPDGKH
jgi:hypothetical protein